MLRLRQYPRGGQARQRRVCALTDAAERGRVGVDTVFGRLQYQASRTYISANGLEKNPPVSATNLAYFLLDEKVAEV